MSHIPVLSDQQIRARVGEQSFQRGQRYFRDGAIVRPVRQGMTLKASCEGSRAEPYRLKVSFDAAGVVEASCSCPVGEEGYCKHMAALLLTWREQPESFIELEELEKTLEQRSKEELLALIKLMLQKDPDLETLLDLPLPTGQKRSTPVNPET
ncbi:MAG TPA: SWIM zinc finger family protein, partial [Ktedonobacterales bacterium]